MSQSHLNQKSGQRFINRANVSWVGTVLGSLAMLVVAWYVGWSPFVEVHWAGRWLGAMFAVFATWALVFAVIQKNHCLIHARKRTVTSTLTTWYFKRITTQYSWDHFCIVRTVLMYSGDYQMNRVELVSKSMYSVLSIAYFPAVTKPGGRTLFAASKYENPDAIKLSQELAQQMSMIDQGFIEEHDLVQLK